MLRGQREQAVGEQRRVLLPDPVQHVVTARGDGDRPRAGVTRDRVPLHVAVLFQHAHQPGQRRGRDPLRGGQVAEAQRTGLLDRGQRGELRRRQPGELVLAQPPGQPRDRDP
jgi:hypothetical protein